MLHHLWLSKTAVDVVAVLNHLVSFLDMLFCSVVWHPFAVVT